MSVLFSTLPRSLRIGVLRGGPSPEYDLSLETGGKVLEVLKETHSPLDIFISDDGIWHVQGIERSSERILKSLDVVWNGLHGSFGEDGGVQKILESHGVRFTGSKKYPSAIAMNKHLTKDNLWKFGIKTPQSNIVKIGENIKEKAVELWENIKHPFVVKPAKGGSAFGFAVVKDLEDFFGVLNFLLEKHESVMVEEFVNGVSVSCLVTENFRGEDLYAFPTSKPLNIKLSKEVENTAKKIHNALDLSHYSQSDFIITPKKQVYFLETNPLPKLGEKSLAVKSMEKVGVPLKDFVHHVLLLSLNK